VQRSEEEKQAMTISKILNEHDTLK
jgi:hypothetical protein